MDSQMQFATFDAFHSEQVLARPLMARRADLDARIRAESARPSPDWTRLSRLRTERERLNDQLRDLRHPL
jgi:predicted kinase